MAGTPDFTVGEGVFGTPDVDVGGQELLTEAQADNRYLQIGVFGSPVASAVGDSASDGVAGTPARSDHRHAREAFGAVTASTWGASSTNGTASTVSRSDHVHGLPSTVSSNLTLADGVNVIVNTTTGSQIGTGSTQKLGFYGATPVAQIAGNTDVLAGLVSQGLRAASSNPPLNLGTGAITGGAITGSTVSLASGVTNTDSSGRMSIGRTSTDTSVLLRLLGSNNSIGTDTSFTAASADVTFTSSVTVGGTLFQGRMRTAASSFTMANGFVFRALLSTPGAGSTITNLSAFDAGNMGATGVTNAYGVKVTGQTGAATLNVGLAIGASTTCALWLGDGGTATDVTGGIAFGSGRDVTIFRSGSNALTLNATGTTTVTGALAMTKQTYPSTDGLATQTACALFAGSGAPNNANGANGDVYFRSDGGALTTIYQRRAGAWVGIV